MSDNKLPNKAENSEQNFLLNYLSYIIDLEKDCYAQKKIIEQLNAQINSNKNEKVNNEQKIRETVVVYNDNDVKTAKRSFGWFTKYYFCCFGAMAGIVIGQQTGNTTLGFIVGAFGVIGIYAIMKAMEKKDTKKATEEQREEWKKTVAANKMLNASRTQRNQELAVWIPRLESERNKIKQIYLETKSTLEQLYAVGIIPEKYRYFVAVCSFYDYVTSGRTYSICKSETTFDEGAVNLYEKDLQFGLIMDKLDSIISNLQLLRTEQQEIRRSIEEGNKLTHNLLTNINNNIGKVNENLDVIKFQNDQQLKCQQYMSSVAYHNYMSS